MQIAIDRQSALAALTARQPVLWFNDRPRDIVSRVERSRIEDAAARLERCAPLIAATFPQTAAAQGRITSPLLALPPGALETEASPFDAVFVKADHALPVGGSIKARGGANAVLAIVERLAGRPLHDCTISVGSTGNLGLSIGTYAARLGCRAQVHMSSDAKGWKKEALRAQGAHVIEHAGDYLQAVAAGRNAAAGTDGVFFIDDEASEDLLYGYAVAAAELDLQLRQRAITVGPHRPLLVYLPCGVGGAPAGIALGLNALYGRDVHCFFAEAVDAPCVMLDALAEARPDGPPHVGAIGLSGAPAADGLAVPRASALASAIARRLAAGFYTVHDQTLLDLVRLAHRAAGLRLEPSATAGFPGVRTMAGAAGRAYLRDVGRDNDLDGVVHVVWTTGGMLLPDAEFDFLLHRKTPSAS